MAYTRTHRVRTVVIGYMTDTMGRMHSDAQFAGSSSVKPYGLFLLRTSAIQTSLIALGLASVQNSFFNKLREFREIREFMAAPKLFLRQR